MFKAKEEAGEEWLLGMMIVAERRVEYSKCCKTLRR